MIAQSPNRDAAVQDASMARNFKLVTATGLSRRYLNVAVWALGLLRTCSFKKNGTICKKCNGFGVLKTTCQQCDHVLDWLLALPDNGLHLESNLAKHDTQCGTAKWPAHGESGDTGGGGISSSSKSSNGSEQKSQGKRKARSDPSGGSSGDNSPSVRDPESKESNADRSDGKGFACIYHKRWPREYPRDTQKHWFISVLL